jgi:hypothetical protein
MQVLSSQTQRHKELRQHSCPARRLARYVLSFAIPGLGMFSEAYFIFAVGNLSALWKVEYKACWADHTTCDAALKNSVRGTSAARKRAPAGTALLHSPRVRIPKGRMHASPAAVTRATAARPRARAPPSPGALHPDLRHHLRPALPGPLCGPRGPKMGLRAHGGHYGRGCVPRGCAQLTCPRVPPPPARAATARAPAEAWPPRRCVAARQWALPRTLRPLRP